MAEFWFRPLRSESILIRAYYLDVALSENELKEVAGLMQEPVEQVRVPHVLPVVDTSRPILDDEAVLEHLRKAGILREAGRQVLFVAPRDSHWTAAFGRAIERLTGSLPYLIQTEGHRQAAGNPGGLRILDMQCLAGGKPVSE
ncbi:MAG: hypothetical protein ACREJ9_15560 [Candidatus Rokuibacteriota bacterium]